MERKSAECAAYVRRSDIVAFTRPHGFLKRGSSLTSERKVNRYIEGTTRSFFGTP